VIFEQDANDTKPQQKALEALLKVVFFDMGLALDTYFHAEHKALTLARSYTKQIVSNIPIGFIVLDNNGHIHLANNAVLRMFGLSDSKSHLNNTLDQLLNMDMLNETVYEVLKNKTNLTDFGFNRSHNNQTKSYLADISLVQVGDEQVVLFMVQDITAIRVSSLKKKFIVSPFTIHSPNCPTAAYCKSA